MIEIKPGEDVLKDPPLQAASNSQSTQKQHNPNQMPPNNTKPNNKRKQRTNIYKRNGQNKVSMKKKKRISGIVICEEKEGSSNMGDSKNVIKL